MKKGSGIKKGFGLIYVILILALVMVLGAGLVSIAGATFNFSGTEINQQQAYITAKSSMEQIISQFVGAEDDPDRAEAFKQLALNTTVGQVIDVPITLPAAADMGSASGKLTCLEVDPEFSACVFFKLQVTATYMNKSSTVSANLRGTFLGIYAELTKAVTILNTDPNFQFTKSNVSKIFDEDGNLITDRNEMFGEMDTSDTNYYNADGTIKPTMQQELETKIGQLYKLDSATKNSLSTCSTSGINNSCLMPKTTKNTTYYYNNNRPANAGGLGELASNYALIRLTGNDKTLTYEKTYFTTRNTVPGLLYGIIIEDTSSQNNTEVIFTKDTIFNDYNGYPETFFIVYTGTKSLKITFDITNNGEKSVFNGWVFAPNADVVLSGHTNSAINGLAYEGGIVAHSVTIENNANIKYKTPPAQLIDLFSVLKEDEGASQVVGTSVVWNVVYE